MFTCVCGLVFDSIHPTSACTYSVARSVVAVVTMVQAGSGLKPESVTQARREVARARQALLEAQQRHDEAQHHLEEELAKGETVSKGELLETVKEEVMTKKEVDEQLATVKQKETQFTKIIRNLQSGGMAGVIARTCVAPMDRIKILQQTAAALGDGSGSCVCSHLAQTVLKLVPHPSLVWLWSVVFQQHPSTRTKA